MKAQTVKEVLVATKWILKHAGWCQGASGRNKDGFPVATTNPTCACRCLTGALWTVECDDIGVNSLRRQAYHLLNVQATADSKGDFDAIGFNDTPGRTKQEVLDLLDRTIARAT